MPRVKTQKKYTRVLAHVREKVDDILEKHNARYKQRQDQHQVTHKFEVGNTF